MPIEIRLPRLGWSMDEGVFVGWLRQPGEAITAGMPLFELEGEKALQEIESVDAGVLYVPPDGPTPGSTLKVGALLGYLLAAGESPPTHSPEASRTSATVLSPMKPNAARPPRPPVISSGPQPPASPSVRRLARQQGVDLAAVVGTGLGGRVHEADIAAAGQSDSHRQHAQASARQFGTGQPAEVIASPRARRVAAELGVDWRRLSGTGAGGRVREADVRAAAPSRSSVPASIFGDSAAGVPLSNRRRVIAERLRLSQARTVPVTLTLRVNASELIAARDRFKAEGSNPIPAFTDLVACAVARVLTQHPAMCVRWASADSLIHVSHDAIHVGIAVDAPDGLLVPVVKHVAGKSPVEIAAASRPLIDAARTGRLLPGDMQGAVLTITNLGSYGIEAFTPVINYPEIAILGLGAIVREPVVLEDGRIVPQPMLTLSLTFDHAAVDGAPAAAFLRDVAKHLG